MTFGLAAGTLLLLVGGSVAAVTALHLLRPPPRRFVVSATLLWQRALDEQRHRPRDQRFWLSLLASLAVAVALALALGDPAWQGATRDVVVVVDNSASLATRTASGETRLDRARRAARALVRGATRALIADTCGQLDRHALTPAAEAARLVDRLNPCADPAARVPAGLADLGVAYLVTDGVGVAAPDGFQVVSVFEPAPNVGFAAFGVRRPPADRDAAHAYVAIVNRGVDRADVEVRLSLGDEVVRGTESVAPGETLARVVELPTGAAGVVTARLSSPGDAFDADDVAYDAVAPARVAVRLESRHPALVRAIGLADDLELATPGAPAVAVAIGSRGAAEAGDGPRLEIAERADVATPQTLGVRIERDHPVLLGVAADDLVSLRAARLTLDADDRTLAAAGGLPLVVVRSAPTPRVRIALPLDDSPLARRPSFPLLVANAVRWLSESHALEKSAPGAVTASAEGDVRGPDGRPIPRARFGGGSLFEAARPGVHVIAEGGRQHALPVDLAGALDVNASPLDRAGPTETAGDDGAVLDPRRALLLLAAALLVAERWALTRRWTQ